MVCVTCRWFKSKEIHKEDIKYWRKKFLVSCVKWKSIYLQYFSMHRNTTSYTKLRRLSCVDLCTQGPCGWLRGTWNLWRVWWHNEHISRVLCWKDIRYTKTCCVLVNIFLCYRQSSIYIAFVIRTPITNLKGSNWRGKVNWGSWKVIIS